MNSLFETILSMSLSAGFLVAVLLGVRFFCRRSPRWILCSLWALVAIRLLIPSLPQSQLSMVPATVSDSQTVVRMVDSIPQPASLPEAPVPAPTAPKAEAPAAVPAPQPAAAPEPIDWMDVLSRVWLAGACLMGGYALMSYLRLRRRVAASLSAGSGVYLCDYIDTPFLLGLFRPRIYLPSGLDERTTEYVLSHERAHLARRDHWWKPMGFVLLSIHWFNPMIWLGYILLCRDIEMACDEAVIRTMGEADKKGYSTALLTCSIPRRMVSICPLAFGEVSVKERIKSVLNYKKPALWLTLIGLTALILGGVFFLTNPISRKNLTLEDVLRLAQKGEELSWSDFEDFNYEEGTDPDLPDGNYVRYYQMEGPLFVKICCPSKQDRTPFAIMLSCSEEEYASMDMQTDDLETFISVHRRPLQPGQANHWDMTIDVADATAENGNLSIMWKEPPEGIQVQFSGKHDLETEVNGEWVRIQPLPGKGWDMDVYNFLLQNTYSQNWGEIYGSLPDGHYRIGRGVQVRYNHKVREIFTVYGEFVLNQLGPSVDEAKGSTPSLRFDSPQPLTYNEEGGVYTFKKELEFTETDRARFWFDSSVTDAGRAECIEVTEKILAAMGAGKIDVYILSGTDYGATHISGNALYTIPRNFRTHEYAADVVLASCGQFSHYGLAYGYAGLLCQELGIQPQEDLPLTIPANPEAGDLNLLCFDRDFTSDADIAAAKSLAQGFAASMDRESLLKLLQNSGTDAGMTEIADCLERYYQSLGYSYRPTLLRFGYGGKSLDYIADADLASFYLNQDWVDQWQFNDYPSDHFLHENYAETVEFYETTLKAMAEAQEYLHKEISGTRIVITNHGTYADDFYISVSNNTMTTPYGIALADCYISLLFESMPEVTQDLYGWKSRGLANHMSHESRFNPYASIYLENVHNTQSDDPAGRYIELYRKNIGRPIDYSTDAHVINDIACSFYGYWDPNDNPRPAASFVHYLMGLYGEDAVKEIVLKNAPLPKSYEELVGDWTAYLSDNYSEYGIYRP